MKKSGSPPKIDAQAATALVSGEHADPFAVLGPQLIDGRWAITALVPGAEA